MNKKNCFLMVALLLIAFVLSSCLFDTDDGALSSWLNDQGLPDSYRVQTLEIEDLNVLSVGTYVDSSVKMAGRQLQNGLIGETVVGRSGNMVHDVVLDFAFIDSSFFEDLRKSDSAAAFVALYLLTPLYQSRHFPSDSLPIKENVEFEISWKMEAGKNKAFIDSVGRSPDSLWYKSLTSWKPMGSADTVTKVKIGTKDSVVMINLPQGLLEDMAKMNIACRLQMRISAPQAKHVFHIYGEASVYKPLFRIRTLSAKHFKSMEPFRMASVIRDEESCTDCLPLHGGIFLDSLVAEFSTKEIYEALSKFYGDDFPYVQNDSNDIRQAVVHAELNFARDDSEGMNEFGLPIQVLAASFMDRDGEEVREMESYYQNTGLVKRDGHPNLVFHRGDRLTLQVTYGVRQLLNRSADGRPLKIMMRLGYPMIHANDTVYVDYVTEDQDTTYSFLYHYDYARYDFASMFRKPISLKLWLASKREEK